MKDILIGLLLLISISCADATSQDDVPPNKVVPTSRQIEYQEMELIGFLHFNMNTFTDKEWGYGDENPSRFDPKEMNVEQWVKVANEAGMKGLILTAKHHDGFCLWPSAYTEHSVKNSPYKNGKGDVVKEFSDACHKYGVKPGLYLSPWDRNHSKYGAVEYVDYYKKQLRELLTNYGEIYEVWFDGANGGDGYYGGAKETRTIDPKTYYAWEETWAMVHQLQPNALIFSDAGPDIRWVGNEDGSAGETFWSTINRDSIVVGAADTRYLNTGDRNGKDWVVGEADVSIRPGWFYHKSQDSLVKSPRELVDIYYKSVGRNAVMLLNVPPNQRGLIQENDIHSLREFRKILDETFKTNLASRGKATASNCRQGLPKFSPNNILDSDNETYWATDDDKRSASIEVDLDSTVEFDRIMIQEPIRLGQRISQFEIQIMRNGVWETIAHGTTVGYKRILRIPSVRTDRIRILIKEANNSPAISNFALYKASKSKL